MFGSNQHRPELPCSHAPSHRNPRANIYSEAFMLTSVSWSPFSSRVQKVLGPSPSTRVCLQCILFSDSQVAKLCRQKENKQDPRLFRFALIEIRCLSGQLRMREFVLFFFFFCEFFKNHLKQQQVSQRLICNHHIKDEATSSWVPAGCRRWRFNSAFFSCCSVLFCFLFVIKPDCREQISYGSLWIKVSLRSGSGFSPVFWGPRTKWPSLRSAILSVCLWFQCLQSVHE